MGGTVNAEVPSHAADTAARLLEAAQGGQPVMIPGARDRRVVPGEATDVMADPAAAHARAAAVSDRLRSEREPDTGGAVRPRTILARLWRRAWRGP